jgi:sulfur carrier protein
VIIYGSLKKLSVRLHPDDICLHLDESVFILMIKQLNLYNIIMIIINGKKVKNPRNIKNLLKLYRFPSNVAIIVNGELIKKNDWSKFVIKDNDVIDVLSFVGGG